MRIKHRKKLELLDNYVAIYRILFNCKQLLMYTPQNNQADIDKIQNLCDQTLDLKSKYEEAFQKLKMIDNAFILLKSQLNECKGYPNKHIQICSISEICDSISIIESDYLKLKL